MTSRTFTVTVADRPAGTLSHDEQRPFHQRWFWRSPNGSMERFFKTKGEAVSHLTWIGRCRPLDVLVVEQKQEEAA